MNRCKECKEILVEKNISSKKDFLKWALKNHPKEGGNDIVSSCNDEYFGLDPKCMKDDYESLNFNQSPKYENVKRYNDIDIQYENFDEDIKNILKHLSKDPIDIDNESLKYLNLILNKLIFYISENTDEGIKKSIKKIFTTQLGIHAFSNCGKSKYINKLIFSEDKVKKLLLKYYLEDITDKQLKIFTCLLDYICSEILEISLNYIKDKKIVIENIKEVIKNDKDELNILINLVLNVPNPRYLSPVKESPKRRASPKERKPCNQDQIRNPKTGRCVLKRSPLGKKILEKLGASPRRASPRRKKQKLKKCSMDKIRNPKTKRCVLKTSPLGKKLLQKKMGIKSSPKKQKPCNPDQIRNPKTGRCVLKRSPLGKKILEMKSKSL